jgi:hypothetical protein
VYDDDSGWFKAMCTEPDISAVQNSFEQVQRDMEAEVDIENLHSTDTGAKVSS